MNDVIMQSSLYRKLVPSKAKLVASAALSTLMVLIVGVGGGLSVMLVKEQQSAWDMLVLSAFMIIFLGILLFIGIRGYRRQIRQYKGNFARLEQFDAQDMLALESEIEGTEFRYKTFYLLDRYMYVPKAKLLIKYTDIREFKTIVHSTNGVNDSMKAEITDNFGIKYTVNIKQWKDFYIYRPLFLKDLDEKIQNCGK
ncbi:hypothetical protein [uncultured Ruminococcus sp.]|uniref:hypothetical protein n=1 Tax=uncultured Ruminococcus sp. TaxID=165186 RepID=UPI002610821D|nr:hypothetical protein [uncultured Ruminococcus sp.]